MVEKHKLHEGITTVIYNTCQHTLTLYPHIQHTSPVVPEPTLTAKLRGPRVSSPQLSIELHASLGHIPLSNTNPDVTVNP